MTKLKKTRPKSIGYYKCLTCGKLTEFEIKKNSPFKMECPACGGRPITHGARIWKSGPKSAD